MIGLNCDMPPLSPWFMKIQGAVGGTRRSVSNPHAKPHQCRNSGSMNAISISSSPHFRSLSMSVFLFVFFCFIFFRIEGKLVSTVWQGWVRVSAGLVLENRFRQRNRKTSVACGRCRSKSYGCLSWLLCKTFFHLSPICIDIVMIIDRITRPKLPVPKSHYM